MHDGRRRESNAVELHLLAAERVVEITRHRRLTPRECARLMGFEEKGGEHFRIVVSDTQAYRQFGNAVVVPVVEAVAKLMLPHILAEKQVPIRRKERAVA